MLKRETCWSSMKNTIWPKTNNADSNQTIEELSLEAKEEGKVLILFPEACSSNGESFLETVHNLIHIKTIKPSFFLCLIQYPYSHVSPTYTVQNPVNHLFSLCCEFFNRISVVRVNKVSPFPTQNLQSKVEDLEEWEDQLRFYITKCTGLKFVSLGVKEKIEFSDFWVKTHSKEKRKKD